MNWVPHNLKESKLHMSEEEGAIALLDGYLAQKNTTPLGIQVLGHFWVPKGMKDTKWACIKNGIGSREPCWLIVCTYPKFSLSRLASALIKEADSNPAGGMLFDVILNLFAFTTLLMS